MNARTLWMGLLPVLAFGQTPDRAAIAASNTAFAWKLYRRLSQEPGNLFFSPYNISAALAMVYAGARGETAQQMSTVMGLTLPPERTLSGFAELERALQSRPYELYTANRLWGEKHFAFSRAFLEGLQKNLQAGLEPMSFRQAPEASRQVINKWVEQQTKDKITNLLPQGSITPETLLVLTSAIYLKAAWVRPFETTRTKPEPFYGKAGQSVQAPLMNASLRAQYFEDSDVQGLELPYLGGNLSMIFVLPNKVDGLAAVERQLTPLQWRKWRSSSERREVKITIPKFKTTRSYDLSDVMSALGMQSAFTAGADFSGMVESGTRGQISLSKVLHKAFVDVNEKGTEAAAATAMIMERSSVPAPVRPAVFRADHPFLFVIEEQSTGTVLFAGRVVDPR